MPLSHDETPSGRLWSRDFLLFFVARTASMAGDMMLPVALTAAMVEAGYGASGVGYALAAHIAPFAVCVVFGGVLADRFGPRRMMIGADSGRLLVEGLLAACFFIARPPLWLVLALLVLIGLGSALFQPGVASVIPRIAKDVQGANATLRVAESLMTVLGPALAGLLLAVSTPAVVLAVDAATFGVSGLCLLGMRSLAHTRARGGHPSLRSQLVEGWQEFRSRAWLWSTIAIWMLGALTAFGPNQTLGFSTIALTHGTSAFGAVMSAFGAGSVLGGLLATRIRPRHPLRGGACAMVLFVLAPLVVALDLPVPLIAAGYAAAGGAIAFWLVMFHTSVQTHIPPAVLGRVHAYDVAGSLIMQPVGRAVAGPVSEQVGVRPYLLFSSAMVAVICVLLLSVPAVRNLRRADSPAHES
ncbi:MFS transporter [Nonomuraea sp. SYSU D8015]|uniref:MFS transporter n=1 Tax=Nonomuraea sp. SYSU D8015 TaxID=2593644 RepID=UPI001CB6C85E|nr:MFS transporter [Nonomuraea sp. SYSU D8015]